MARVEVAQRDCLWFCSGCGSYWPSDHFLCRGSYCRSCLRIIRHKYNEDKEA
jgi:hypothetical protein